MRLAKSILIFVNKCKELKMKAHTASNNHIHSFGFKYPCNSAKNCFEICLVFSYLMWIFLHARP
jgi:hypothetical protein